MTPDYLVIGSGLTGAVMARLLHDAGARVLVLEKRPYVGGNVRDEVHPSGIRVHTYGPHYFRTSDTRIWRFVTQFADFYRYVPCITSFVDGRYENWPIAASYIRREIGEDWIPAFQGDPANFEEAALKLMPEQIYHKFVRGYTIKQWGVDPRTLSADLVKRFDVRLDDDPRLIPGKKFQGIPVNGYTAWMEQLLAGIPVLLNTDYIRERENFHPKKRTIYTGPIDAFFDYRLGKLKYRGQQRTQEYLTDVDSYQLGGQVNNPGLENGAHIRTLEWKHIMPPGYASRIQGTVITREVTVTPTDPDAFEYPFPDAENAALYAAYRALAVQHPEVLICGRLGEYTYYDMDQAIGRAMMLAKQLI